MSGVGRKRTTGRKTARSVLPSKADSSRTSRHVRKVPKPEVRAALFDHFVGAGPLLLAPDCQLSGGLRR
jgi:hypothetical protein